MVSSRNLGIPIVSAIGGAQDSTTLPNCPASIRICEIDTLEAIRGFRILRIPVISAIGGVQDRAEISGHPAGINIYKMDGIKVI